MRKVLYSAIFGGYDTVPPLPPTPGVDRVMFTDDPNLDAPGWEVRVSEPKVGMHPRMQAKRFKLLPHWCVPEYEQRVWMDGSHTLLTAQAFDGSMAAVGALGVAFHKHPGRNCIYDEAEASMRMVKYEGQPIMEQVLEYRKQGHPDNWGLWACGTIASTHAADEIFEEWWGECKRWSYQDQISLPVVMRRVGRRPGEFPWPQGSSPWFQVGGHLRHD